MTAQACNCEQSRELQAALDTCERDTLVKVAKVLRDEYNDTPNDVFGVIESATGSTHTATAVMKAIGEEP